MSSNQPTPYDFHKENSQEHSNPSEIQEQEDILAGANIYSSALSKLHDLKNVALLEHLTNERLYGASLIDIFGKVINQCKLDPKNLNTTFDVSSSDLRAVANAALSTINVDMQSGSEPKPPTGLWNKTKVWIQTQRLAQEILEKCQNAGLLSLDRDVYVANNTTAALCGFYSSHHIFESIKVVKLTALGQLVANELLGNN